MARIGSFDCSSSFCSQNKQEAAKAALRSRVKSDRPNKTSLLLLTQQALPRLRVNLRGSHEINLYPIIAKLAGGKVPDDRIIDGVDQTNFFLGKQMKSDREALVVYVGSEIYGVKWRNWKMMFKDIERGAGEPTRQQGLPLFIDLYTDMKEEHPMDPRFIENVWVRWPAGYVQ
jgi:hypothetical protein